MEKNVLIALLSITISLFIILIVSFIIKRKTRDPIYKKEKRIHKISSIIFWIDFIILSPLIFIAGIYLSIYVIIYAYIISFIGVFIVAIFGSSSKSYNYKSNNKKRNNYQDKKENDFAMDREKRYCHYEGDKVSTIYDNGTVIRSDGVYGYRRGDYIYYNDDTTGHVVMLDDEKGIIE